MPKKNDVFQLVKSLTKAEKKRFRQEAQLQGRPEKTYVELFDLLEKADAYDTGTIAAKLKGTHQLHTLNRYLYDAILRSLRSAKPFDVQAQIKKMQEDIAILYRKGTVKTVRQTLAKAISLAERHELFETHLELLNWELFYITTISEKKRALLFETRKKLLQIIENKDEYRHLHHQLNDLAKKGLISRNPESQKLFDKLQSHPLLQNAERALTQTAKMDYLQCHIATNTIIQQWETVHDHCMKLIAHFHTNDFLSDVFPNIHVARNIQAIQAAITSKRFENLEQLVYHIAKMEEHPVFPVKWIALFESPPCLLPYYFDVLQNTKQARNYVGKLRKNIAKYKCRMNDAQKIMLYGNLQLFFFKIKDYDNVLYYANKILGINNRNIHPQVFTISQTMELLTYGAKEEYRLLESKANAAYMKLSRAKQHVFATEKYVALFFKRYAQTKQQENEDKITELFLELDQKLHELRNDEKEKHLFTFFDFKLRIKEALTLNGVASMAKPKQGGSNDPPQLQRPQPDLFSPPENGKPKQP